MKNELVTPLVFKSGAYLIDHFVKFWLELAFNLGRGLMKGMTSR